MLKNSLVVAILLAAKTAGFAADAAVPAVGAVAPPFTLNSQDGKPVRLADFRGKWVVLYFYPKDFTGGCTLEAHNFQKDLKSYEDRNAVILGVSAQSAESHQSFCTKEGLSFKLLADEKLTVSRAYGSVSNWVVAKLSSRNTFIIGPDGTIVKEFLGVAPGGHSREVLAALSNLAAVKSTKESGR